MRLITITIFLFLGMPAYGQRISKYQGLVDSLRRSGQSQKLIPFFEKENRLHPHNEDILRWLGALHFSANYYDEGERYYGEALKVNPKCARCYANLSRISATKGNYTQAFQLADKAIELDKTDAQGYLLRAKLKQAKGDKDEALFDYNKAIELEPENASMLIERATYNQAQHYPALALADYNKAVDLAPKGYDVYFKRASYYFDVGMPKEAWADINTAFSIDSNHAELYTGRAALYSSEGKHEAALADYTKAITLNPSDFSLYYYRADERYKLEDMDGSCTDTRKAYELLLGSDPSNPLIKDFLYNLDFNCDASKPSYYYQRGIAAYNLGKYDEAIAVYTEGLKKFPDNALSLSFRGNANFAAGNYKNAITDYYAAIAHKDNLINDLKRNVNYSAMSFDSLTMNANELLAAQQISIAESKAALGLYDEALIEVNKGIDQRFYTRAVAKEVYYNVRGNILLELGNTRDAIADFDKCIQLNPDFPLAYINRAIAKVQSAQEKKFTSYSIRGSFTSPTFVADWTSPSRVIKPNDNNILRSALEDCNKAVQLDPKSPFHYFIRGQIKKMLSIADYCTDIGLAKSLDSRFAGQFSECR